MLFAHSLHCGCCGFSEHLWHHHISLRICDSPFRKGDSPLVISALTLELTKNQYSTAPNDNILMIDALVSTGWSWFSVFTLTANGNTDSKHFSPACAIAAFSISQLSVRKHWFWVRSWAREARDYQYLHLLQRKILILSFSPGRTSFQPSVFSDCMHINTDICPLGLRAPRHPSAPVAQKRPVKAHGADRSYVSVWN
jgi:hypothetical protein